MYRYSQAAYRRPGIGGFNPKHQVWNQQCSPLYLGTDAATTATVSRTKYFSCNMWIAQYQPFIVLRYCPCRRSPIVPRVHPRNTWSNCTTMIVGLAVSVVMPLYIRSSIRYKGVVAVADTSHLTPGWADLGFVVTEDFCTAKTSGLSFVPIKRANSNKLQWACAYCMQILTQWVRSRKKTEVV